MFKHITNQINKVKSGRSGQVGIIIIFIIAVALIFYAVSMNIGRVSQTKTITTIAANSGAALLGSQMASYGQSLFQTTLGGKHKLCAWTGVMASFLAFIIIVVSIIAFNPAGIMLALVLIGAALSAVAVVAQAAIINPGLTNSWNRIITDVFSTRDGFIEQGINTALQAAVTDNKYVPDLIDADQDRKWGFDGFEPKDEISRFGVYYSERLKHVELPPGEAVADFLNDLAEFLRKVYNPDLGCFEPNYNPGQDNVRTCCWEDYKDGGFFPAECNPCCLPPSLPDPTDPNNDEKRVPILPPCCDCAKYGTCPGGDDRLECGSVDLCGEQSGVPHVHTPYMTEKEKIYPYVYDPFYENPENGEKSIRQVIGRDDEHRDFIKEDINPNGQQWHRTDDTRYNEEAIPQKFYLQDTTGFWDPGEDNPPVQPLDRDPTGWKRTENRVGLFDVFYKIHNQRGWTLDLAKIYMPEGEEEDSGREIRKVQCHWCDKDYHREMEDKGKALWGNVCYECQDSEKWPWENEDLGSLEPRYPPDPFPHPPELYQLDLPIDPTDPTMDPRRPEFDPTWVSPDYEGLLCNGGPGADGWPYPTYYVDGTNFDGRKIDSTKCGNPIAIDKLTYPHYIFAEDHETYVEDECAQSALWNYGHMPAGAISEAFDATGEVDDDPPNFKYGFYKMGGDRYCSSTWPYAGSCSKHQSGRKECHLRDEKGELILDSKGESIPDECECTQSPEYDGGIVKPLEWPDDVLDDIVYGLPDFYEVALGLLNMADCPPFDNRVAWGSISEVDDEDNPYKGLSACRNLSEAVEEFAFWYVEIAPWIEGPPEGDSYLNRKEEGTGIPIPGALPVWKFSLNQIVLRLEWWLEKTIYAGDSADDVWCVPSSNAGAHSCEIVKFDVNCNRYRGDFYDTSACLNWNVGRTIGEFDKAGQLDACRRTCDPSVCTELPRVLIKEVDPSAFRPQMNYCGACGQPDPLPDDELFWQSDIDAIMACEQATNYKTGGGCDADVCKNMPKFRQPCVEFFDEDPAEIFNTGEPYCWSPLYFGSFEGFDNAEYQSNGECAEVRIEFDERSGVPMDQNNFCATYDERVNGASPCLQEEVQNCCSNTCFLGASPDEDLGCCSFDRTCTGWETDGEAYEQLNGALEVVSNEEHEALIGGCLNNCQASVCDDLPVGDFNWQEGGEYYDMVLLALERADSELVDQDTRDLIYDCLHHCDQDSSGDYPNLGNSVACDALTRTLQGTVTIDGKTYDACIDLFPDDFDDASDPDPNGLNPAIDFGDEFDPARCEPWYPTGDPETNTWYDMIVKTLIRQEGGEDVLNSFCDLRDPDGQEYIESNYTDTTVGPFTLEGNGWLRNIGLAYPDALNLEAKIEKRADFVRNRLEELVTMKEELEKARDIFQNFLSSANALIAARKQLDSMETGLPYHVIYGWQGDPPEGREPPEGSDEAEGYWHIVRVDARIPGKCDGACDPDQNQVGTHPWPRVDTRTKNWGTRRCYELKETEGSVKIRVTRWDEDRDPETLTFPNGVKIWDMRFFHPDRPGTDDDPDSIELKQLCDPIPDPDESITGDARIKGLYAGAFILNNPTYHKDEIPPPEAAHVYDPQCWNLANEFLAKGVVSETCAEYYFHKGLRPGLSFRFVDCKEF